MPLPPVKITNSIFVSYSHADYEEARELLGWLKPMLKLMPGTGELWVDYAELKGGALWESAILDAIDKANVFLVLMSIDYVNSPFCLKEEFKRIMGKHARGSARVIGIALKTEMLEFFSIELETGQTAALSQVQCLPQSDRAGDKENRLGLKAVDRWPKDQRRQAWEGLVLQIKDSLNLKPESEDTKPASVERLVPIAREQPQTAPVGLSEMALPYLVDRHEQSDLLSDTIVRFNQAGCARPLVIVTAARQQDCPDRWVERMAKLDLLKGLRLHIDGRSFGSDKTLSWPSAARTFLTMQDAHRFFVQAFSKCFFDTPLLSLDEIHAGYLKWDRPLLLAVDCKDDADLKQNKLAFSGLLSVLAKWPALSRGNMLVVALTIGLEDDAVPAKSPRLMGPFKRALADAESEGAVVGEALGKLADVDVPSVVRWAKDHCAERIIAPDVVLLCKERLPPQHKQWPMLTFAAEARHWLKPPHSN